jgi:hypothetical protein
VIDVASDSSTDQPRDSKSTTIVRFIMQLQLSHLAWVVRNEWKPVLYVLTWLDIIWSLYGNITVLPCVYSTR